ncbi:MAG: hypothetical protein WCK11_04600 [Candidatus Falkowbacteria bacterium]
MSTFGGLAVLWYNLIIMTSHNFAFFSSKTFAKLVWGIIYFPVWWYTEGLFNIGQILYERLKNQEKAWGFLVWVRNIFRPMYGLTDFAGVVISILVRIVQIIFRGVIMLFWVIFLLGCLAFWLVLPLAVIYQIGYQLGIITYVF